MANIEQELLAFKNAKKGEDVRDSMISAIRKINTVNEEGVEEIGQKSDQMVEIVDSQIQIDEEPTQYTKLKLETTGTDIEVLTAEELDEYLPETETIGDLKNALCLTEYDASQLYGMGDYVWHNNSLYQAKVNILEAESWTSGHWNLMPSTESLKSMFYEICKPYDSTRQYLKGEYCRWVGKIRRCKVDTAVGGEAWTAGHWEAVTLDVLNELFSIDSTIKTSVADLQEQINEIKEPDVDVSLINAKSWDVDDNRYKHVVYSEKLFTGETLTRQTAQMIEKSYDIRYHNNPYSVHFKTNTSNTSTEIRITIPTAFTLSGTQEFDIPVYISDATNITNVQFRTSDSRMSKVITTVNSGWNMFRFFTEGSGFDGSVSTTLIRFFVNHSAGTDIDVYIGSILQVSPDKGSLILIDDGPYYSFYTTAYPALKTMGVPVTWAIDAGMLDADDATDRFLINENELEILAYDGLSEFSFHRFDSSVSSPTATAQEALADTLNSIRYLRKKGIQPNKIWRAAWLQNSCADASLANLEVDASASGDRKSANMAFYPFPDRFNIPRYALGGASRTETDIDNVFTKLKNEHCVCLAYIHGIASSGNDMSLELWNYFKSKLQNELADSSNYLNVTTYNRLVSYYEKID